MGGSHLSVKDGKRVDKCNIKTELDLSQAFTRRALAFDLMGAATFSVMEKYHQFLLGYLQMLPPPGYAGISVDQCLRGQGCMVESVGETHNYQERCNWKVSD